ncbi:unnamed protein product [Chrysodeixis includens]|uniref:Uncharacterized protein n=1 Tax=Chrysodeixis includens TaxID=689277 RepID=A0A9N8Q1K7_CHRIL|nr:unnamed protein product [Chrysodeixis includens]
MRRIFINCLLLASLAVALPNGRNKRDFSYLRNLAQKILYGNNELNIELTPSSEELQARDMNKFRLYEVPGYDIMIKVPVDDEGNYNGEVPVNLNAFGATVGTNTPGNTVHALSHVNNLVSSGILNDNHDQMLRGSFGPIFPNGSDEAESYEEGIDLAKMGEPGYTENGSYEEAENFKEPVEFIEQYNQEQSEESNPPMVFTADNEPAVQAPQTIVANSDLTPNCDRVRVDTGYLLPPEEFPVERVPVPQPETYPVAVPAPAPAPAFVNVFYPNPADHIKNPRTTENNHHHKHHVHHHRHPHHHHHPEPHHHEHDKSNETSTDNGTIMEGSTTEDPVNYRVQFVSRVSNTETFQGINTGTTLNNTAVNATNPIGAGYGSNQFAYRNQDDLKMVTYDSKLKTNNGSSPVTSFKDESGVVNQKTSSNVTEDLKNSSTSTEKTENGNEGAFTSERSRNNHGHHHPRHPHHHHQQHPHHHVLNHHPLPYQNPPNFGINGNPNGNDNNPTEMTPENKMSDEVPLQKFEDTKTDTDDNVAPTTDSTDSNQEEFTTPSESADQKYPLRYPMSTDEDPRDQNMTFLERLRNIHLHRSGHPSKHPHHHHKTHHSHEINPAIEHAQIRNIFDIYPELKSMMDANLHTNKVQQNPDIEETTTELDSKLKENEDVNDKGNQNNSGLERENERDSNDTRPKDRGDVPDE